MTMMIERVGFGPKPLGSSPGEGRKRDAADQCTERRGEGLNGKLGTGQAEGRRAEKPAAEHDGQPAAEHDGKPDEICDNERDAGSHETLDMNRDGAIVSSSETEDRADVLHYLPSLPPERPPGALERGLDDPYLVIRDLCVRGVGVDCDRCVHACPGAAISMGEDGYPHIDEALCTHCGICAGICDGFSSTRVTMEDLYGRIMRIAASADAVYLTCDENLFEGLDHADNVVVLPCLALVPPQLYALLLAEDVELIIACDLNYCDDCLRAPGFGEPFYTAAIQTAERWTGRTIGFTDTIPEKRSLSERLGIGGTDRRSLFMELANEAGDVASGNYRIRHSAVLQEFHAMQERMRATVRSSIDHNNPLNRFTPLNKRFKKLFPRQDFLYTACKLLPEMAPRVSVRLSVTNPELCDQQLACLPHCPTAARAADDYGNLIYDARYCIGCGTCLVHCPRHACSIIQTTVDHIPGPVTIGTKHEASSSAFELDMGQARLLDADDDASAPVGSELSAENEGSGARAPQFKQN